MKTTIKGISEEFSKGNFVKVYPHFSTSISWTLVGDRTLKGKSKVLAFCNKMNEQMAGSKLKNTHVVTEKNSVAVEGICRYKNAEGKTAKVEYCDVYRFKNGKVASITSYTINS